MTDKKIKTTILIEEKLYKEFSVKVIQKFGGRKNTDVIAMLMSKWVKEK